MATASPSKAYAVVICALHLMACFAFEGPPLANHRTDTGPLRTIFHLVRSRGAESGGGAPSERRHRPIVLIPGFAQSLDLYLRHVPALSQDRDVLIYQALGTGLAFGDGGAAALSADLSLPAQAERLRSVLDESFGPDEPIDLVGFSLGGRIALATATVLGGGRVRCLHLTGVGLQPSPHAEASYLAWKELLWNEKGMHGFAWNVLLATYDASFLLQNRERLASWVGGLAASHTATGLLALLQQTHGDPEWSVESMSDRLPGDCRVRLLVGRDDRMVPVDNARALAACISASSFSCLPGCAHAVPMESPLAWRQDVVEFLNR